MSSQNKTSNTINELIGKFAEGKNRRKIASQLATKIGAKELVVFIKDSELGILLPAVSFFQTFPVATNWIEFLNNCIKKGIYSASLPYPTDKIVISALGIAYKDICVMVFLGGTPQHDKIEQISQLLPLVATVFTYEQKEQQFKAELDIARKSYIETSFIAKKLDEVRHELHTALEHKDEFLGIASHELKTPVTSIKAYGQILQRVFAREGNQKAADQLAKMDAQIDKLTSLISDLLDVTKIQAGKLVMQNVEYDFNTLVNELVDELQLTTERHTLIKQLGRTKKLHGDKERTGQIITNLISNAIKYSPHTDKIIIKTENSKNEVTLCVQDFGVGIPKDKQDKVFAQFFRVSGEKQYTFPGLGLGLYISSEIVKRQGGRIWVESTEGKGSTFCFSLPSTNLKAQNQTKHTLDGKAIEHESVHNS